MYCAGHLLEAALAHETYSGSYRLLGPLLKYIAHINSVFGPEDTKNKGYVLKILIQYLSRFFFSTFLLFCIYIKKAKAKLKRSLSLPTGTRATKSSSSRSCAPSSGRGMARSSRWRATSSRSAGSGGRRDTTTTSKQRRAASRRGRAQGTARRTRTTRRTSPSGSSPLSRGMRCALCEPQRLPERQTEGILCSVITVGAGIGYLGQRASRASRATAR